MSAIEQANFFGVLLAGNTPEVNEVQIHQVCAPTREALVSNREREKNNMHVSGAAS